MVLLIVGDTLIQLLIAVFSKVQQFSVFVQQNPNFVTYLLVWDSNV